MKNKCSICQKPTKEDTEGNLKYCQGHSQSEIKRLKSIKQRIVNPDKLILLPEPLR